MCVSVSNVTGCGIFYDIMSIFLNKTQRKIGDLNGVIVALLLFACNYIRNSVEDCCQSFQTTGQHASHTGKGEFVKILLW